MTARTLLLCAAASLAMTGAAQASGWYVSGDVGINWIDDADVSGTALGVPTSGTVSTNGGWAIVAAIGAEFAKQWRLEGEFAFRQNDTTSNIAYIEDWSLMLNVLYDFELSTDFGLSLGGGLGMANSKFNLTSLTSDNDVNAALQIMAGLSYAVTPQTDLTLTYRYLGVFDPSFQFGQAASFDFDSIRNRSLTVGVRWRL